MKKYVISFIVILILIVVVFVFFKKTEHQTIVPEETQARISSGYKILDDSISVKLSPSSNDEIKGE